MQTIKYEWKSKLRKEKKKAITFDKHREGKVKIIEREREKKERKKIEREKRKKERKKGKKKSKKERKKKREWKKEQELLGQFSSTVEQKL